MLEVTFEKSGRKIEVESGANLREAAIANKVSVYSGLHKILNCRGRGMCSSCRVEIVSGTVPARNETEEKNLKRPLKKNPNLRLACQITVEDNLVVRTNV